MITVDKLFLLKYRLDLGAIRIEIRHAIAIDGERKVKKM